ncbi:MAG TPA: DUF5131 family protein [Spirochaetota bacterium]|nr:DUF5131 family protein [Spirochaetota bacterium]HOM38387.1 DUF5131 family protein [Spirochaetota bacterium]HPQ48395.1 DUF5131 family protein [Spirochaetota bacterium]
MIKVKAWNPFKGCKKFSSGCKNCYAYRFAERLRESGNNDYNDGFDFKLLPDRLKKPFSEKKKSIFFVNSMGDLFYERMSFNYIDKILNVIEATDHIYMILTKRAERMRLYFGNSKLPKNLMVGVTVENISYKHRIDILRSINAYIKFISFEPLLGYIKDIDLGGIDWAIVGGETGAYARPMSLLSAKNILQMCKKYNVSFYFKQYGTFLDKKCIKDRFNLSSYKEYPQKLVELVNYQAYSLFERMGQD